MHFDNSHSKTGQTTVNFLYSFHIKVSNKNKNKIGGHHGCDQYGSWIYNYLCNQCL